MIILNEIKSKNPGNLRFQFRVRFTSLYKFLVIIIFSLTFSTLVFYVFYILRGTSNVLVLE